MLSGCGSENASVPDVSETKVGTQHDAASELTASAPTADSIVYPEVTMPEGAKYDVSATVTKITPTGLTLNYYRESEEKASGELFTGEWFALERCTGEGDWELVWEKVPPLPTAGNFAWRDIAYPIPAQNKTQLTVDWTALYGALDPGAYRLVKILYERTSEGELYGKYDYLPFRIPAEPFAGYGLTLADVPAEKMPISDPIVKDDFCMTAEDVTPRGATLRFSHGIIGGYDDYLETYNGETWERVPYLPLDAVSYAVPEIAVSFRDTYSIRWTSLYGELEPGAYRLAKNMGIWENHADYFAYFEIIE